MAIYIEVAEAPDCAIADASLAYGILVDADRDPATGFKKRAVKNLGIDARLSATCDPVTEMLVSPLGPVQVDPTLRDTTLIEISTTVDMLPSVNFYWIAYATENGEMVRAPDNKDHRWWAVTEIITP